MSGFWHHQLAGPTDPARDAGWENPAPRKGFFTDTSICIGCKACEVACKEWNQLPSDNLGMTGMSYDNTSALGASTWRHVAFVEQSAERIEVAREEGRRLVSLGMPAFGGPGDRTLAGSRPSTTGAGAAASPTGPVGAQGSMPPMQALGAPISIGGADGLAGRAAPLAGIPDVRWLMASDVCKHCTHAGCLDACPTGALFRSEFGTVVVQPDVCNGCGYCVPACPFGVIERRETAGDAPSAPVGVAQKCTLCYDRLEADQTPACAKACPTTSIKYGDREQLREIAQARVDELHAQGITEARLYGANDQDGVGGTGSIFLLLDDPEVYGLPPDPEVATAVLPDIFRLAGVAGTGLLALTAAAFAVQGWRRR